MIQIILVIFFLVTIFLALGLCYTKEEFCSPLELPPVFYINLAHRTDRKKELLAEFDAVGWPRNKIHRIEAIKKDFGHTGCRLSHIKALKTFLATKEPIALIVEDDFGWLIPKEKVLPEIKDLLNKQNQWDRVGIACFSNSRVKNGRIIECIGAAGYLVNRKEARRLLQLWLANPVDETNHRTNSIDQIWNTINTHKTLHRPLGRQRYSYSDIEKKMMRYRH